MSGNPRSETIIAAMEERRHKEWRQLELPLLASEMPLAGHYACQTVKRPGRRRPRRRPKEG